MAIERLRFGELSALTTLEGIGVRYRDGIVRNHITTFVQNHKPGIVLQKDTANSHVASVMQNELHV